MKKTIPILFTFVFAFFLTSCIPPADPVVGGACSYKTIEGVAFITSIEQPTGSSLCKQQESKAVRFKFVADNKQETDQNQSLEISNIHTFPVKWLKSKGFVVGSKHRMSKMVIQSGTCTPVIYSLSGMDENHEVAVITKMCNALN